ncbi:tetratricopeptide repeat-containing sulfotransferase family protein [Wenzhouxiangella sp. EGI_FJ10409]|uniref:tetratricopeptide repeat-containing sulfotransferase family protein n=1 Tax=Wenzhouxiangella sp. EGI_FJ10409 TaxID=3243767 RepID=UPI0035E24C4D
MHNPPHSESTDHQLAQQAEFRLRQGDLAGARETFWELARRNEDAGLWLRLAEIDHALGDGEQALRSLGRAGGIQPRPWQASARIAELFFELGRPERSLAILDREAARDRANPRLQLLLAQAREDAGQREGAIDAYRHALACQPGWPAAMGGLLRVARDEISEAWLDQAQRMLAASQLDADERAVLGYSLGRALERRGDFDGAFHAWRRANELRRRQSGGLDHDAARLHADRQIQRYSPDLLARPPALGASDRIPLFIVGMPRSGTTLLERMIGAHPDAIGYGELPTMGQIARQLERHAPTWPAGAGAIDDVYSPALLQGMADFYYKELDLRSSSRARFSIDKAPLNFFQAGLISLLLNHSRIIVCERDPRDVCLSIYSENFAPDQAFATDLDDLVFFHHQYRRLISHWQQTLPNRVRCVRYEDLVDAPAETLEPLLEWIGMPWDDACLDFHDRGGEVATPSRWQVRQPIYRSSMGRWRNFEPHIDPLLNAFGSEDAPTLDD